RAQDTDTTWEAQKREENNSQGDDESSSPCSIPHTHNSSVYQQSVSKSKQGGEENTKGDPRAGGLPGLAEFEFGLLAADWLLSSAIDARIINKTPVVAQEVQQIWGEVPLGRREKKIDGLVGRVMLWPAVYAGRGGGMVRLLCMGAGAGQGLEDAAKYIQTMQNLMLGALHSL
ncbi:hypothetical protein BDN70DRAFT_902309, partial [Pholiota conissans]